MSPTVDNNPFITGYVINYKQGDQSLERFTLSYQKSDNDEMHSVTDYDTLWNISFDKYGTSKYWWVLADVNNIFNPFELTVGSNLLIPDINRIKAML